MNDANDSWWRNHFDRDTLAGYGLDAKAAREVRGLTRLAGLKAGDRVLDLCCGAGRHAVLLAKRGLRVTGVDIKPDLLAAARKTARARGASIQLLRKDMRRLRFLRRFDAAINLFTSFGYFASEAEDLSVLQGVRRALKPGGTFVIDLLNKEWLMRRFTPSFRQREADGPVRSIHNRLSFDFVRGRLDNRRTLIGRDGRRRETRLSIRVYTLTELRRLLRAAGLTYERVYGGLDGKTYGMDTFRMVVLAQRPVK